MDLSTDVFSFVDTTRAFDSLGVLPHEDARSGRFFYDRVVFGSYGMFRTLSVSIFSFV